MSPGRQILVLTSSHLCRNPRVVKEASTLGAAGYDVTVMSVSVHAGFEALDREIMRGLPFRRVTLDYTSGRAPGRLDAFLQRGATWGARRLCAHLGIESAQSLGPAAALLRFARSFPADLTIAHTEIPLWAARQLIRDGRRVAVDMEDWYSEDLLPADRRSRPVGLLRQAEAYALQHASYVTVTSRCMAEAMHATGGGRLPTVLRNSFPLQPKSRVEAASASSLPRFIWFSQTVGPGRGLENFLAAWSNMTRPASVHLLGEVRPGYRENLVAALSPAKRSLLHFLPPVPPADLPLTLARFDVGLALESHQPPSRDVTITNKILQYLNAGLAVVATDTAGQIEVMESAPDAGVIVSEEQPDAYTASLDRLIAGPERLRAAQLAARAVAEREYSWELESRTLLRLVASALTP